MSQIDLHASIRRLQFLLAATALLALGPWVLVGFLLTGQRELALPITVSARGLKVVGEDGRTAATLAIQGGSGRLNLLSAEGKPGATLAADKLGGSLTLTGAEGKPLLSARNFDGLGGALLTHSPGGKPTAYLGADPKGGGNLTLRTAEGEPTFVVRDDSGHGASVQLMGDEDHTSVRLGPDLLGNGQLRLLSGLGKDLFFMGANPRGDGQFEVSSAQGENYAYLLLGEDGASHFSLLSPTGKPGARLSATPHGGESLLSSPEGQGLVYGGWTHGGGAQLKIWDDQGHPLVAAGAAHEGGEGGGFHAFGEDSRPLFYAGVNDRDGSGILSLFHSEGKQIVGLGVDSVGREGVLNLRNQSGDMTLRLP
ncbi:MAG: hypothetical protein IPK67_00320 [Planctomycetes bacterium]|nr:hypothetical protein [Planctomycetota bacterium]